MQYNHYLGLLLYFSDRDEPLKKQYLLFVYGGLLDLAHFPFLQLLRDSIGESVPL